MVSHQNTSSTKLNKFPSSRVPRYGNIKCGLLRPAAFTWVSVCECTCWVIWRLVLIIRGCARLFPKHRFPLPPALPEGSEPSQEMSLPSKGHMPQGRPHPPLLPGEGY